MLWLIVALPFFGALLASPAEKRFPKGAAWLAGGTAFAALVGILRLAPRVLDGELILESVPWVPRLGLELVFRLDGLSLLFALLVLGIGVLVILYARYYLSDKEHAGRFFGLLLLFMGAMLGLVVSGNLLQLLVFWEGTSLSSFLLIGFWKHRADARQGARQALMITGAGGLALLGGVLLIGDIVGSYDLSTVLASGDLLRDHALYPFVLVLVLGGAFTKSAQFPFHFWLPHAMAAPTPVSAYLHSATMVKAGVFLIARVYPVLGGTDLWFWIVGGVGLVTMVFGAYTALFEHDLKGLLAYSTISHLGLITLLFGLSTPLSEVAAVFHIINHAVFKASLFMAVGIIDHECGTRDMRRVHGMMKYMPITAALAITAAAAMAGVPLLNGFLSKEMFLAETLHVMGRGHWLLPALGTLGSTFSVAYSARFVHDVFFNGEPIDLPREPHEPPRWMRVPVAALVAICIFVGIAPQWTVSGLLAVAASAVLGPEPLPDYSLSLWHGFNLPLLMSTMALVGGVAIYAVREQLFAIHARILKRPVDAKALTDDYLGAVIRASRRFTVFTESGSLRSYTATLIVATLLAAGVPLLSAALTGGPGIVRIERWTVVDPLSITLLVIGIGAAVWTAISHRRRLLSLVLLGAVGLVTSLAFAGLAAPDLALTQLLVEVASILLLLLALYFLPQTSPLPTSGWKRVMDVVIASVAGIGAGYIAFAMLTGPQTGMADFFLDKSVSEGGGANAVNVILADFRAFDTFGEATVLAIAALVVFSLLHAARIERIDHGERPPVDPEAHPVVLAQAARPLLPLAILVAIFLFFRGHNAPGGGFAAGLVVGVALVLQYMASGTEWAQRWLPKDYRPVVMGGVLILCVAGALPWLANQPFLDQTFGSVKLPLLGKIKWASASLFEIGVMATVIGTVLLILTRLGRLDAPEDEELL